MTILRGWRYNVFIGGLVGVIALTLYPIAIEPMLNSEKYKKIQERNRRGIKQEDVQPGNMKVWSDPFGRK
ncbi:small integral membrane protein 20 [Tribolium castaneum]|uniref:Small integral membrane protein 20-like Protein n=1 Tax=Tribolium castaneum TaxID=7070 RepID=D6WAU5_TRICA|nr:PREDICTED: small integral membrane protein 20 [Tribolium castaneum]EEZ97948.2 Small integral membrane protein 20-like Protein [Tribolium castaneum]|eukprot:XP_001808390.2 PREDICTED: small integral membrane protein 20 [Tribolium castaneum]